MGKPILGEHSRLEVIIEESCEFKVCNWLIGDIKTTLYSDKWISKYKGSTGVFQVHQEIPQF